MGSGAGWLAVAWSFGVLAAPDEPPARGGGVLPLAADPGEPCDENARYPAAALAAQATATAAAMIAPRPRVRRGGLLCNGLPLREPPPRPCRLRIANAPGAARASRYR